MGEPPDISQLLPDFAAAGGSICCVCQREGAGVLLDRAVRIFFHFGDFAELVRGSRAGEDRVTRFEIFLSRSRVLQF